MKKRIAVTTAMLDDIDSVATRISRSLKSHKVVVSTDRITDDLVNLIGGYTEGKSEVRANTRTTAADTEVPPYNMAADLISTAFALFEQGKAEKALKQIVVAFQTEGMTELAQALAFMNDEAESHSTPHAVTAASADDDEEDDAGDDSDDSDDDDSEDDANDTSSQADDDEDDDSDEDDDTDDDSDDDSDWGNPDADGDDEQDAGVIQGVVSEMTEPPSMDLPDDEDDDEDESVLLSQFRRTTASSKTPAKAKTDKGSVALANAMSLSGSPSSRRVASRILSTSEDE